MSYNVFFASTVLVSKSGNEHPLVLEIHVREGRIRRVKVLKHGAVWPRPWQLLSLAACILPPVEDDSENIYFTMSSPMEGKKRPTIYVYGKYYRLDKTVDVHWLQGPDVRQMASAWDRICAEADETDEFYQYDWEIAVSL